MIPNASRFHSGEGRKTTYTRIETKRNIVGGEAVKEKMAPK